MQWRTLIIGIIFIFFTMNVSAGTPRLTLLSGYHEIPAIYTDGHGTFESYLNKSKTELKYILTFSDLSSPATVAHIHFGERGTAGGILAFLCGGGGKPACPANGGVIYGKIKASDILAIPAQGIKAGHFKQFLAVLDNGSGYANVHTSLHPGGEIRGQLRRKIINDTE